MLDDKELEMLGFAVREEGVLDTLEKCREFREYLDDSLRERFELYRRAHQVDLRKGFS